MTYCQVCAGSLNFLASNVDWEARTSTSVQVAGRGQPGAEPSTEARGQRRAMRSTSSRQSSTFTDSRPSSVSTTTQWVTKTPRESLVVLWAGGHDDRAAADHQRLPPKARSGLQHLRIEPPDQELALGVELGARHDRGCSRPAPRARYGHTVPW